MNAIIELKKQDIRKETDSLGEVDVPSDKLWGAQTQRSLEHFNIGQDLIPREMIAAYATLKKAAANANHADGRLDDKRHKLIVQTCDEILAGQHHDMFPLHVWMTGSGTQFNMNVNEVISNRCCERMGGLCFESCKSLILNGGQRRDRFPAPLVESVTYRL